MPKQETPATATADEERPRGARRSAPVRGSRHVPLPVVVPLLFVVLLGTVCLAVSVGSVGVRPATVVKVIADHLTGVGTPAAVMDDQIVWNLRLPRVLLAAAVGAGLAVVGVTPCRRPSAIRSPTPSVLGVSAGAGLMASIVITLDRSRWPACRHRPRPSSGRSWRWSRFSASRAGRAVSSRAGCCSPG